MLMLMLMLIKYLGCKPPTVPCHRRHYQAEGVSVARNSPVAALKKCKRQQVDHPPTRGLANRPAGRMKAKVRVSSDNSMESRSKGRVLSKSTSVHASGEEAGKMGSLLHGGFIKNLQTSPLWKDPFSNPNVFLYLKAEAENPYRLSIVKSVESCSDKFYTLSMNGLVFSTKDRTEFVTVEQFERQYM